MKSLKDLFIIGPGPSSSHTIGPYKIGMDYRKKLEGKDVKSITITLYQSLAFTGRGHFTDKILLEALKGYNANVVFDINTSVSHPNTLSFTTVFENGTIDKTFYVSYGGGVFGIAGEPVKYKDTYPFSTFSELKSFMDEKKIDDIFDVVTMFEDKDILSYGEKMVKTMFSVIEVGINKEGYLPGNLHLIRVAKSLNKKALSIKDPYEKKTMLLSSFAYSTSEENASNGFIVTAPTCGSAGVVPSVLYYEYKYENKTIEEISKALLVSGLVGDFVKTNASISGAVHGCQAEIGTACSMASAALCYLYHLSFHQVEYASEVAMEHFLGLTCDPVEGYVQIPCIERNAIASIHAYASFLFSKDISPLRKNEVSFDEVVSAMKATGDSLSYAYKETSLGGLAGIIKK